MTTDLTVGKPSQKLFWFSIPLLLSVAFQQLYQMADSIIVGRFAETVEAGELALAAVDQRLREEGIRDRVSIVIGGSVRNSSDLVKAIALGADAVYIATSALLALGCHLCRSCQTGKCNWGIATQRPELVRRLNPDIGEKRLINLLTSWDHELKEMMGGMGINSIEALRGNRLMLRGIGLTQKELDILGVKHAGE